MYLPTPPFWPEGPSCHHFCSGCCTGYNRVSVHPRDTERPTQQALAQPAVNDQVKVSLQDPRTVPASSSSIPFLLLQRILTGETVRGLVGDVLKETESWWGDFTESDWHIVVKGSLKQVGVQGLVGSEVGKVDGWWESTEGCGKLGV